MQAGGFEPDFEHGINGGEIRVPLCARQGNYQHREPSEEFGPYGTKNLPKKAEETGC